MRHRRKVFRPDWERMEDRTLLATMLWTNAAGGDWDVASNWVNQANPSDQHVPTASDDAQINLAGITVTHAAGSSDSVNSLTVASGTTLSLSNGTLAIASASTNSGILAIGKATLAGAGTLTNAGSMTASGGSISSALVNQGTITILPGSSSFAGGFSNAAGATLRVQSDNSLGAAALTVAQGFTNAGLIDLTQIDGGAGYTAKLTVSAGTLVNAGTITSSPGTGGGRASRRSSTTRGRSTSTIR